MRNAKCEIRKIAAARFLNYALRIQTLHYARNTRPAGPPEPPACVSSPQWSCGRADFCCRWPDIAVERSGRDRVSGDLLQFVPAPPLRFSFLVLQLFGIQLRPWHAAQPRSTAIFVWQTLDRPIPRLLLRRQLRSCWRRRVAEHRVRRHRMKAVVNRRRRSALMCRGRSRSTATCWPVVFHVIHGAVSATSPVCPTARAHSAPVAGVCNADGPIAEQHQSVLGLDSTPRPQQQGCCREPG